MCVQCIAILVGILYSSLFYLRKSERRPSTKIPAVASRETEKEKKSCFIFFVGVSNIPTEK